MGQKSEPTVSCILSSRAKGVAVQVRYVRDGVIRASDSQGVQEEQSKQDMDQHFRG